MRQPIWSTITSSQSAPTTCGVYQYWSGDTLLYIGKAINIRARLTSHAQIARLDAKEAAIVAGDTIKYTLCDSEFKALLLESQLIRQFKPPHNRAWKDDKSYLYIVIDLTDPFPRPHFARAHDLPSGRLFGPFPNSKIAEEVLSAIRRLIPFCMARHVTSHPCFYSRIGLCSPCPANIIKLPEFGVQKRQYHKQILQLVKILDGNIDPVIQDLTFQMKQASKSENFELALQIRTKIERFHSFTDRHFSYDNSSEKLLALETLLKPYFISLQSLSRIECYDASNSALHDSTVSLTVMSNGLLDKGQYRRYKIKNPHAISDFDRLDEAIIRRLKNTTWPKPDLIIIDGGVPQLRRLQRIFDRETNPPFYLGLAKHPDRLIVPNNNIGQPDFLTLKLSSTHPALQLLEQLRDEAHRFANSYRKILEKKRTRI